jgi:hypothetical protein
MTEIVKLSPTEFEEINKRLADIYGKGFNDLPYFRLVWSEDLLEKRLMTHTREGFELPYPEVREVPKYRQWIQDKYVLEGLTIVPDYVQTELIEKLSYEPVWTFEDRHGNYLIPKWGAIHFILETQRQNIEKAGTTVKYKDPDLDPEAALANREARIKEIEAFLFGDENPTTDALAYKEGVTVPHNFERSTGVN